MQKVQQHKNIERTNLTGSILVAHPLITANFFAKTVVFVYEHSTEGGAQGVILNRPLDFALHSLFAQRGYTFSSVEPVYKGGPVNERAVVMLHTPEWYSANTISAGCASVSSDTFMIDKMATLNMPNSWRMLAGICGWASGQLEAEIQGKIPGLHYPSWLTAQAKPSILFECSGEEQYTAALALCSQQWIDQVF